MKKITTLASAVVLSMVAGSSFAAVLDVDATLSATITGAGTGTQTGTGTGTYDTATQILSLDTTYRVSNSGLASGVMDQTGKTIIDFSAMSGSNEVLTCNKVSGFLNLCSFVPSGPQALETITGTWESFQAISVYSGATTTQNWEVTSLTPPPSTVPVPASAWLFGSALLGLTGAARRRIAKA